MKWLVGVFLFFFFSLYQALAGGNFFGVDKIDRNLRVGGDDIVESSQNIVIYFVGLLYFIAVVLGIWAGIVLLTSSGDDDKVKKGKKILVYVAVGLIVVFLASTFIRWLTTVFTEKVTG